MRYKLSVPARVNVLGNPSDANEGDFATISAAVDLRAGAFVEAADGVILESLSQEFPKAEQKITIALVESYEEYAIGDSLLPYTGELDLLKGAINRLYKYSAEFRQKYARQGVHIATWSNVPRQSGLGGSSLFVILALAGLRQIYDLDPLLHNNYVLAELTQRVESLELGITCGFADRYVPIFGGLAYLDYRGKLYHREIQQEPYGTYERLESYLPQSGLPLVMACTGIPHDSGDVHAHMRPRYIEEYDAWALRGGEMPPMVGFMSAAWETAWRGKIALLQGDLPTFGALMNENHGVVDQMMSYCGFTDGAGWANNLLIQVALENGALGAKLTGAGGGGSVFALTRPGEENRLVEVWNKAAAENGLEKAWIYQPKISNQGLLIREI